MNKHEQIVALFNATFSESENTRLISGAPEPLYLPASQSVPYRRIFFRSDYTRSALHEIAHWCIAGRVRREIPDYGYWYVPDGRSKSQQQAFEQAEVKPQALEWLLSLSCGVKFEVSLDNLEGDFVPDKAVFTQQVVRYAAYLLTEKPAVFSRFWQFKQALQQHFNCSVNLASIQQAAENLMNA